MLFPEPIVPKLNRNVAMSTSDPTAERSRPTSAGSDAEGLNVLLVTLDQFRGDCLGVAGHPVVQTPTLDRLAERGVYFSRHYSQAAPCAPGRASVYTGMYLFNHRVVANGTPLDDRFDNVARALGRAGYRPTLFGYTDQAIDPRVVDDEDDPRLFTYEGVLPGFEVELDLTGPLTPWREYLVAAGYEVPDDPAALLRGEPNRPAETSLSAFMTDRAIEWLAGRRGDRSPWFAHLSYLRPHPPYAAAGRFSTMYPPDRAGEPIEPVADRHPLHAALCELESTAMPGDPTAQARLRSQYFGMISEVDHQLGRLIDALGDDIERTLIVITADHGDQLGDHGYRDKAGFFEQSYHIPAIICDPRFPATHGRIVTEFTENVDLLATICEAVGVEIPIQCDGASLAAFVRGDEPARWRSAAHWEFDWRHVLIGSLGGPRRDHRLEQAHLAVLRRADAAWVQFGDGSSLGFDLAADPTWRTPITDPQVMLDLAREMLVWRSGHTDRTLADTLLVEGPAGGVTGRRPVPHPASKPMSSPISNPAPTR